MNRATLLSEYLATVPRRFDWAAWHCAHYVAGWYERATGRAVDVRDMPSGANRFGAYRAALRRGGPGALVGRYLAEPLAPGFAQLGDIVRLRQTAAGAWTLGICSGRLVVCLAHGGGLAYVERGQIAQAWRVPQ